MKAYFIDMSILCVYTEVYVLYCKLVYFGESAMAEVGRKKSPRAPSLSLSEAFDRAMKIYESERLHPAPTDVVAQALGYKSANNGTALGVLASLRYFGLLERPKDGFLCVNRDLETYKFTPDENLKKSLIVSFLKKPPLYREMLEKYEAGLPSEANLRFELIQKGFSPQTSEPILEAFLQSVDFANYYSSKIETPTDKESQEGKSGAQSNIENRGRPNLEHGAGTEKLNTNSEADSEAPNKELGHDRIPVRLPGGRKAWLLIPAPFFEADKARLKAQVDLLLSDDEV